MSTHLRQTWADSGVVADLLDAPEVSEAEKREKLTPREVFDLLLYARGEPGEQTESQFVRFTHLARKVLRGVSGDTAATHASGDLNTSCGTGLLPCMAAYAPR